MTAETRSSARRISSGTALALAAGIICAGWAFLAWLTVIPNQDMLADAIQVQSVIADPRIVLAFPGQKHAGPLEYPVQILAEIIAPANYYAHTLARVVFAFLTGLVAARLYRVIVPNGPSWSFLGAVLVGPAVMHGLAGPEGNRVGVQWLVGNYDLSWLLVSTGAWVLARAMSRTGGQDRRWWVYAAAGLLVGLGFFAHPNVTLLIIPLAVLVLVRFRIRLRDLAIVIASTVLGVIPAGISYVVNADITTWDPSHPLFISIPLYLNALGLDGMPDYITAVLPSAIGFPSSSTVFPHAAQSVGTWIFVVAILVSAIVGITGALRGRRRPSAGATIALAWIGVFAAIILFAALVAPVWFYASSLSILLWITIGALPVVIPARPLGSILAAAWIAFLAVGTISHNAAFYGDIPARMSEKQQRLDDLRTTTETLESAGAEYVFGSYFDVIPIAYASNMRLRAITTHYNRFPISDAELQRLSARVAVRLDAGQDGWMLEAIDRVNAQCRSAGSDITLPLGRFGVFDCPPSALIITR